MKNISRLILPIMVVLSCTSKPVTEKKIDKGKAANTLVLQELIINKEKIYLLSLASKVPYDTVNLIIKDYYLNEYDIIFNNTLSLRDSSIIDYKESIQSISRKYHLTESKVASLLFSYKYEMRTPDQIIDEYQEQQTDYREFVDQ